MQICQLYNSHQSAATAKPARNDSECIPRYHMISLESLFSGETMRGGTVPYSAVQTFKFVAMLNAAPVLQCTQCFSYTAWRNERNSTATANASLVSGGKRTKPCTIPHAVPTGSVRFAVVAPT